MQSLQFFSYSSTILSQLSHIASPVFQYFVIKAISKFNLGISSWTYFHLYPPALFLLPLQQLLIVALSIFNSLEAFSLLAHTFIKFPFKSYCIKGFIVFVILSMLPLFPPTPFLFNTLYECCILYFWVHHSKFSALLSVVIPIFMIYNWIIIRIWYKCFRY